MQGDGNGWAIDPDGSRNWGLFGAAGLLLTAPDASGTLTVLLQHRAVWSHHGDTWAIPGGARDSHETAVDAAVREAHEETGIAGTELRVVGELVTHTAPSGWSYTTVFAEADTQIIASPNKESAELRWVTVASVDSLNLHPAFAQSWELLKTKLPV